ncbi:MAG: DUF4398 domain-containing protein, partial [Geminicoccaceae bacterium]
LSRPAVYLPVVLGLAACAGENVPEAQLARAQLAVDRAVAAQAGTHAPTELSRARSELGDARKAVDDENYTEARRLADQAEADATLAETRAQAAVESENLEEMKGTVGDLQESTEPAPSLVPN